MAGEVQTYTESSGVDEAQLRKDISAKLRTKKAEADFNAWADAQIEKLATGKKNIYRPNSIRKQKVHRLQPG